MRSISPHPLHYPYRRQIFNPVGGIAFLVELKYYRNSTFARKLQKYKKFSLRLSMKNFLFAKQRRIFNYAGAQEVIPIKLGFVKAFLIKGDGSLILVDTGTPGSEQRIVNKIKRLGFNPSQISLIIITHAHNDHTGSVKALKKITGAKVAVHKDDAGFLINGESADITPTSKLGRIFAYFIKNGKTRFDGVVPDIQIENEMGLKSFGIKGKVISTPGHTLGSISILLDSGRCILADTLMAIGGLSYSYFSNNVAMLKESLLKIINSNVKEVYLSHGGVYSIDKIRNTFHQ